MGKIKGVAEGRRHRYVWYSRSRAFTSGFARYPLWRAFASGLARCSALRAFASGLASCLALRSATRALHAGSAAYRSRLCSASCALTAEVRHAC